MDYYAILGLSKTATDAEIKTAYRSKAKEHHPDKGGDANIFKEVSEAYSVLSDPQSKAKFDRFGYSNGSDRGQGGFDMNDIFSNFGDFFGAFNGQAQGRGQRTKTGRNIQVTVNVTIFDILFGAKKSIKYTRKEKCKSCDGKGGKNVKTCQVCNGSGQIMHRVQTNIGFMQTVETCTACDGTGEVVETPCEICDGLGATDVLTEVDINIPGGVADGMRMEIPGKGDYVKNGNFGNLLVHIKEIFDPNIIRDGNNILIKVNLPISTAVLGGDIIVATPHGDMNIRVEVGTQGGHTYEYSNMGIPIISNDGRNYGKGDMLIITEIIIPSELTAEQKEIFLKLKEIEND